jgi:DNA-binding XRE family transcriptional regulator
MHARDIVRQIQEETGARTPSEAHAALNACDTPSASRTSSLTTVVPLTTVATMPQTIRTRPRATVAMPTRRRRRRGKPSDLHPAQGQRVRELRIALGLTQDVVARALSLTRPRVTEIESHGFTSVDVLEGLAQAFAVPVGVMADLRAGRIGCDVALQRSTHPFAAAALDRLMRRAS